MTLARERQPGEQMEVAALFPPRRVEPRLEAQAPPGVTNIVTGMLNRLTDVFQRDDVDATVEEEREEEDGVLVTPNMT